MTAHQCEGCGLDAPLTEECPRCEGEPTTSGHDLRRRLLATRDSLCEARADLAPAREQLQRERTMRENAHRDRVSLARQLEQAERQIKALRRSGRHGRRSREPSILGREVRATVSKPGLLMKHPAYPASEKPCEVVRGSVGKVVCLRDRAAWVEFSSGGRHVVAEFRRCDVEVLP